MKGIVELSILTLLVSGLVIGNFLYDGNIKSQAVISDNPTLVERSYGRELYRNKDGTYNLRLYSGIKFVERNGKWINIIEARSLKKELDNGLIKIRYLSKEKNLDIEILDLNYTNIKFKPVSTKDKDVQVKINSKNITKINPSLSPDSFVEYKFNKSIFNNVITIGETSTDIRLETADTENLDDTYIYEDYPDTNYGTGSFLKVQNRSSYGEITFIKWNLSSIPNNKEILSANLTLNKVGGGGSSNNWLYIESRGSTNITWDEESTTWNSEVPSIDLAKSDADYDNCGFFCSWKNTWKWNVTDLVDYGYSNLGKKITLVVISNSSSSTAANIDFGSKEYENNEPFLDISYDDIAIIIPQWSNVKEPTDPSDYLKDGNYQFNITWVDGDIGFLEFNDTTDLTSMNNYTMLEESNEYYYTVSDIPAGEFRYKFYANSSTDEWNDTDYYTFTIDKINSTLNTYLNGTLNSNKTYNIPEDVNYTATGYSNDSVYFNVYLDGSSSCSGGSPSTAIICETNVDESQGTHSWKINSTSSQNYSYTERIVYAIVNPENTCTYDSGDWNIECSDNCNITSQTDLAGNDFNATGVGYIRMTADIINVGNIYIQGVDSSNICTVTCNGGCFK